MLTTPQYIESPALCRSATFSVQDPVTRATGSIVHWFARFRFRHIGILGYA